MSPSLFRQQGKPDAEQVWNVLFYTYLGKCRMTPFLAPNKKKEQSSIQATEDCPKCH
jgi:hypothetical protein